MKIAAGFRHPVARASVRIEQKTRAIQVAQEPFVEAETCLTYPKHKPQFNLSTA